MYSDLNLTHKCITEGFGAFQIAVVIALKKKKIKKKEAACTSGYLCSHLDTVNIM